MPQKNLKNTGAIKSMKRIKIIGKRRSRWSYFGMHDKEKIAESIAFTADQSNNHRCVIGVNKTKQGEFIEAQRPII